MKPISKTFLTLGTALLVAAPTTQAVAAPAGENYQLTVNLQVDEPGNRLRAEGTIRDLTSGTDQVCVETVVEFKIHKGRTWRHVTGSGWKCGKDSATATVPWRKCGNKKKYRAKVRGKLNGQLTPEKIKNKKC
jgi:hypothetical protein